MLLCVCFCVAMCFFFIYFLPSFSFISSLPSPLFPPCLLFLRLAIMSRLPVFPFMLLYYSTQEQRKWSQLMLDFKTVYRCHPLKSNPSCFLSLFISGVSYIKWYWPAEKFIGWQSPKIKSLFSTWPINFSVLFTLKLKF